MSSPSAALQELLPVCVGRICPHLHGLPVNRTRSLQITQVVHIAFVVLLFPWIFLMVTSSVSVCKFHCLESLLVNFEKGLCEVSSICTGFCTVLVFFSHAFCTQKDIFHCILISRTKYHELREYFFVTLLLRKQHLSNLTWSFSLFKRSVAGF